MPCSGGHPEWHIQGDVLKIINQKWDLIIAFPPCTYLTTTGNRWLYHPEDKHLQTNKRRPHPLHPDRLKLQKEAIEFVKKIWSASVKKMAIENPVGVLSTKWLKPTQYIQPYWFGDEAQKKTGLWLRGLPPLKPTNIVKPKIIHKESYSCPEWMYKTGGSKKKYIDHPWHYGTDSITRSKTFPGVAAAMAEQWGNNEPWYGELWG